MINSADRYADGRSKAKQAEADSRYRAKQREQRAYLREICAHLGTSPEAFVTRHNAKFVATLIQSATADKEQESDERTL